MRQTVGPGTAGSGPLVAQGRCQCLSGAEKIPRLASRSFRPDGVRRGCASNTSHYNREPGFFAIGVEKVFSFRADWHQEDRARPLVGQYQTTLDSVLQSYPELRGCLAYCAHCGIRFLTHPRNAGRRDLRCPFGCRQHHRRQRSSQRSTAYYQTAVGRRKKKRLNGRRSCSACPVEVVPACIQQTSPAEEPRPGATALSMELRLPGVVLDESSLASSPMLPYVQMLVGLIEGIELSCGEVVRLLKQAMRQHSMGARRRVDYLLSILHQHPP